MTQFSNWILILKKNCWCFLSKLNFLGEHVSSICMYVYVYTIVAVEYERLRVTVVRKPHMLPETGQWNLNGVKKK